MTVPLLRPLDFRLRLLGLGRILSLVSNGTKGSGRQEVFSAIRTAAYKSKQRKTMKSCATTTAKKLKIRLFFFITNLQIFIGSEANYGKSINDILFIQRLTWLVGRAAHAFSHLEFHWPLLDVLWVVRCFTVIIIALLA